MIVIEPWAQAEELILVDDNDLPIGTCEKYEAHKKNLRHRAFSVFIFNKQGQTLLQQRAVEKYHSPNLWTNTCCGHPRPGEDTLQAAMRRLKEETNFTVPLFKHFVTNYQIDFDNGLSENEIVHVFWGVYDTKNITPNPLEVRQTCWEDLDDLKQGIYSSSPNKPLTYWFEFYFKNHMKQLLEMRDQALSMELGNRKEA